jgi:hypothetical protein
VPRPRRFDEQDIVDHAMELFWTRGYEATSVADLTAGWAAALTVLVQGLQVVAKADPDPRRLIRVVDTALAALAQVR